MKSALAYKVTLEVHPPAAQNVHKVQNVHKTKPAPTKNVAILAQEHAVWVRGVKWLPTILFVVALLDTLAIHSQDVNR